MRSEKLISGLSRIQSQLRLATGLHCCVTPFHASLSSDDSCDRAVRVAGYDSACTLAVPHRHLACSTQDVRRGFSTEVLPQVPPLRYAAEDFVYTDASKRGTSITAAWAQPGRGVSQQVSLPPPSKPERTIGRGELAAIHTALHSGLHPGHIPMHIATDSLTSLQLISGYMESPHDYRLHKHRWLVAAIAQNIIARPGFVKLSKVRAHSGIKGNEMADRLATDAHELRGVALFSLQDTVARGPLWVHCPFGESVSDVHELHDQPLQLAKSAHVRALHARPASAKSQAFVRFTALHADSGGLHCPSSTHFWTASCISQSMVTTALKVRMNTLPTRSKLAQWYPDRGISDLCSLCRGQGHSGSSAGSMHLSCREKSDMCSAWPCCECYCR